jgi:5-methyltetrahydrofolate--homocysteine methyltransferase
VSGGPLLLDGAMATRLHAMGGHAGPAGACDVMSLSEPLRIRQIHDAYLTAGADIVRTNTFRTAARDHASDASAICAAAARLARDAADEWSRRTPNRPRFVAGAIGPPAERGAHADVRDAYRTPSRALLDAGVDLLLFETCFDPAHGAAALAAAADAAADAGHRVPVVISFVLDAAGRLAVSGASLDDAAGALDPAAVSGLGLNCGIGVEGLEDALALLRRHTPLVTCHPSAGLPDAQGRYPIAPADFARRVAGCAAAGLADVVGGCCGTTPEHVAALARAVRQ